jgi:hypothetical protein
VLISDLPKVRAEQTPVSADGEAGAEGRDSTHGFPFM